MGCRCCKYSKWREDKVYVTDPIPYVDGEDTIYFKTSGGVFTYNGTTYTPPFNLIEFKDKEITFSLENDQASATCAIYIDGNLIMRTSIGEGATTTAQYTITDIDTILIVYDVYGTPTVNTYTNDKSLRPFTIADISYGSVDYDFSEMADYFDRFYDCWYIVNPCCDFVKELQLCYDGAKERLDAYYHFLTNDFNPKQNTVMDVDYGARKVTGKDYTYPITGDVTTSTPNAGAVSDTDAVKDTTTVTKDTDPFKTLERVKAMQSFKEYFCEQFKDCFTITSGVTW